MTDAPSWSALLDAQVDAALAVLGLMVGLWLVSLWLRDVSIVDSFWGPAFVLAAWIHRAHGPDASPIQWLHLALVTVWGLRLAIHIASRHAAVGEEDYRYRTMRQKVGKAFAWRSLFTVFLLQGVLVILISTPLLVVQAQERTTAWTLLDLVAIGVWLIGFAFEAGGDWQLRRFRDDPANKGRVLDTGFWRYSRHPNYFGDAAQWWAYGLFALGSPGGPWTLASVFLMTFFLLKVSGVTLLERTITKRRPAYQRYIETTPAFVPWFPKQRGRHDS
ncbi:MAG: DUF1295 domain-containing protein [Acidobacteriota bacterium]